MKDKIHLSSKSLIITALFSLFFFILCFYGAKHKSFTTDEVAHIPGGFMIWKTGDFRINLEHPPLVKLFSALPLLPFKISFPLKDMDWIGGNEWHMGGYFLFMYNDADLVALLSKFPIILLGFLLGWGVYSWGSVLFVSGRRIVAPMAGLFCAVFYFTEPNLIAHSALVTYDLPFAFITFFSVYLYWSLHVHKVTWVRILGFLFLLALAPLVKVVGFFLWGLIFPHLFILALWPGNKWRINLPGIRRGLLQRTTAKLTALAVTLVLCGGLFYFFLWACYGFRYRASPGMDRPPGDQAEKYLDYSKVESPFIRGAMGVLRDKNLLPQAYLTVLGHALIEKERAAVLLGEMRLSGGFFSYFFFTTLLKTPLLHLGLFVFSIGYLGWLKLSLVWKSKRKGSHFNRRRHFARRAGIPLYFIIGFFLIISYSRVNLGHRLILMIIPFECLLAGNVLELFLSRVHKTWRNYLGGLVLIGLSLPAILSYPNYISYFNRLIGDRSNATDYLADSNVDWGQDIKTLGRFLRKHGIEKVNLSLFGTSDPFYYGIHRWVDLGSWMILIPRYEKGPPDPTLPTAVSANMLAYVNSNYPDVLQTGKPLLIGGSIFLFPPAY